MRVAEERSIAEIGREAWGRLEPADFPFWDYDFLAALEESGCVGERSGWIPLYLTLHGEERIDAALVLFVKDNSYGEYIFDWDWARAYAAHGVAYYPKLSSAVPFTPATGPKLLIRPGADEKKCRELLVSEALRLRAGTAASSLHFLFVPVAEIPVYEAQGLLVRHSVQFHWTNRDYADFDAFLATLKSRKRKQIVRERKEVQESGLEIQCLTGDALTAAHAEIMFSFYQSTIAKMGAIAYLNEAFFAKVFSTMKNKIVFVLATRYNVPIAGALHYRSGRSLFGRYWGCVEPIRHLHFELCYYQAIEFAIKHQIKLVEAGAQGEHKVQRGFLPSLTYSTHWIADPRFRAAIGEFLGNEKAAIADALRREVFSAPYANTEI